MNRQLPCPICKSNTSCTCQESFVRFFELLKGADQDVSTCIPASEEKQIVHPGGLDKLTFALHEPLSISTLYQRAKAACLTPTPTKLNDNRWYLQIGLKDLGIYAFLGHSQALETKKIVTNPNSFPNFQAYMETMRLILTQEEIQKAKIIRLDLNLDLNLPLSEALRHIDVKSKHNEYENVKEGKQTGLRIGKKPEKVVIYDKALEQGLNEPRTRIEWQLSGKKLPALTFDSLFQVSEKNSSSLNLSEVLWLDTALKPDYLIKESDKKKYQDMTTLLEFDGYYRTKHKLNPNRNFERDYGKFLDSKSPPKGLLADLQQEVFKFIHGKV